MPMQRAAGPGEVLPAATQLRPGRLRDVLKRQLLDPRHAADAAPPAAIMVELAPDPDDRRHMIVSLTETGARMRQDAQRAMDQLADQLADRLGHDRFDALLATLEADWGDNIGAQPEKKRRA